MCTKNVDMHRRLFILFSLAVFFSACTNYIILPMVTYVISPLDRILTGKSSSDVESSDVDQMFLEIEKNRDNEKAWKALHHYSSIAGGGYRMHLFRDCFNILKKDNLIFFNRYLKGDEQALLRMIDALTYDFSAFSDEKFEVFDETYKKILERISKAVLNQDKKLYQRASNFDRISREKYIEWRLTYTRKDM
jgi:hypothetical protein